MHRLRMWTGLMAAGVLALGFTATARAADPGPYVGAKLGAVEPTNKNYRAFVQTGIGGAPYVGYRFNEIFGVQGDVVITSNPGDSDVSVPNKSVILFGGRVGPRLDIPLGNVFGSSLDKFNLWGLLQGGALTGLNGGAGIARTGGLFSVGAGLDYKIAPHWSAGIWGDWNKLYTSPRPYDLPNHVEADQGPDNAQFVNAGVTVTYNFWEPTPPLPPPPPPPAAAPPPKKKLVLRAVYFDFDKSNIRKDAVPVLNEAVEVLKSEPNMMVSVEGNTDSVGTDAYNMRLSIRRAESVKTYLVQHGISASRLTVEGFGETKPVASNATAEGRQENRRVELKQK
jgi:outer membrane protein OmpA-like peptidoglycan-associated protein